MISKIGLKVLTSISGSFQGLSLLFLLLFEGNLLLRLLFLLFLGGLSNLLSVFENLVTQRHKSQP